MAQREFYFSDGVSYMSDILSRERNFIIRLQFCYADAKTIFLERSAFRKDYSLKEHTWLTIYKRGHPRKAEVQPAAFIPTFNTISKRQALPCLFFYTLHDLSRCNDGKSESRQFNRPTWVDRDGTDLNFTGNSIIFMRTRPFALIFYRQVGNIA